MNKKEDEMTKTSPKSYFQENKLEKENKELFQNLNIYNLIKSESLTDKNEALELLMKYFNDKNSLIDKYKTLIKISKEIFPLLFNISLTPISDEKNIENIELYINTGKYFLQFLFNKEFLLDFTSFENEDNLNKKFPCLLLYNKSEIIKISELNNKRYKILQYDILKKFNKELSDLYIKYFINPMIIYDTNFEIQYLLFQILKYLYFLCKEIDSKNMIVNYISEVLINLSLFKKQSEYETCLDSREFGYYLLLHEKNFKFIDNSLFFSPKNEKDIYTTKFNMATDLINKALYMKQEISQGKSFEILENIISKYSILYLDFYIEDNKEISLTIYKKNEKEKNFEQIGFNNIIKTVKMDENNNNKENNYKIAKIIVLNSGNILDNENKISYSNQFKIVFDNYDSWFTNRILHYSISIFEKIDE